jgi:hypothetical protein
VFFGILVVMDRYVYLLLGIALLAPLVPMLLSRKDLALKAAKLGLLGGIAGLVAELFYFRDYWRPPSLLGVATISVEDFVFGFAITALSFAIFPSLFGYTFKSSEHQNRSNVYLLFFIGGFGGMLFFNVYLHINSIFVSSGIFIVLSAIMLFIRRDLLAPALYSAAALTGIIVGIYVVLFNVLSPNFWDTYWLLANTKWGVTILGNLPLTELLWYFSWIVFASISYPFVSGKVLSK